MEECAMEYLPGICPMTECPCENYEPLEPEDPEIEQKRLAFFERAVAMMGRV